MRRSRRPLAWAIAAAAVVAMVVPASTAVGWASNPAPFTAAPITLPSAGGLVKVQIDSGYAGSCPLTTSNPGVSLARCMSPSNSFDVWVPPNTSSSPLVTTFQFSGSIDGQPPTTASSSVTQLAPTTLGTYVALGDSYASGEGNPDPRNGGWVDLDGRPDQSPTANDGCDRSWLAYPRWAATWLSTDPSYPQLQFVFLACSGVTTSDVWSGSPASSFGLKGATTRHMEGVQLADTADLARARIVTMTVGANDIGFSPTGKVCTPEPVNHRVGGSPAGRTTSAERRGTDGAARVEVARTQPEVNACTRASTVHAAEVSPARFAHLAQTLEATYAAVKAAAPGAALYIVGYPYLVPTRPSARIARIGCDGIPGPELASLAKLEVGMDGAAKAAARAEGAIYVDPNAGAPASFAGHDVCSARGVWFNALMKVKQFSYHPNATGQVKLFEDLRASIEAHGLAPRAVRR